MDSKPVDTIGSGEHLTLPEPDPDNITVLTRNLPNTPILPWNHYDSPWSEPEAETTEPEANNSEQDTQNLEPNAETLEEAAQAEAITPVVTAEGELESVPITTEVTEPEGELAPAQITSEVTAEGELQSAPITSEVTELEGELAPAQITSEVTAEGELQSAPITSNVTVEGEFNAQRLIALLDLPEETATDELTG
ncbi:hypothetical protein NDI39_17185 [Microcoleus sp. ZQ-A2]|nr:hypothetical protein [Microcoleus sp. FACHB-1]